MYRCECVLPDWESHDVLFVISNVLYILWLMDWYTVVLMVYSCGWRYPHSAAGSCILWNEWHQLFWYGISCRNDIHFCFLNLAINNTIIMFLSCSVIHSLFTNSPTLTHTITHHSFTPSLTHTNTHCTLTILVNSQWAVTIPSVCTCTQMVHHILMSKCISTPHHIIVVVNLIYGGENTKTLKCSKPPNSNY